MRGGKGREGKDGAGKAEWGIEHKVPPPIQETAFETIHQAWYLAKKDDVRIVAIQFEGDSEIGFRSIYRIVQEHSCAPGSQLVPPGVGTDADELQTSAGAGRVASPVDGEERRRAVQPRSSPHEHLVTAGLLVNVDGKSTGSGGSRIAARLNSISPRRALKRLQRW